MNVVFYNEQVESLGIEYLSAVLKQAGHRTSLVYRPALFANYRLNIPGMERLIGGTLKDTINRIIRRKPDMVAFTVNISNLHNISRLVPLVKQRINVPIVLGGPMVTSTPQFFLDHGIGDFLVIGEGEEAMLELVTALETGKDPSGIANLWFNDHGRIVRNPARPFLEDLDTLPFPDRGLYHQENAVFGIIMATRGCPFSCKYCVSGTVLKHSAPNFRHYYRLRDPLKVVEEAGIALNQYGVRRFHFMDDIFPVKRSWLETFSQAWKRQVARPFDIYMSPTLMDSDLVKILAEAGCKHVNIGLQSAVPRIYRGLMGRRFNLDNLIRLASDLHKEGVSVSIENIVGIPTETRDEMISSLEWSIKNLSDAFITYYRYIPLPGTPMAALAAKTAGVEGEWLKQFMARNINYKGVSTFQHPDSDLVDNILFLEDSVRFIPEQLRNKVLQNLTPVEKIAMKPIVFTNSLLSSNLNWLPSYMQFYGRQLSRLARDRILEKLGIPV